MCYMTNWPICLFSSGKRNCSPQSSREFPFPLLGGMFVGVNDDEATAETKAERMEEREDQ